MAVVHEHPVSQITASNTMGCVQSKKNKSIDSMSALSSYPYVKPAQWHAQQNVFTTLDMLSTLSIGGSQDLDLNTD